MEVESNDFLHTWDDAAGGDCSWARLDPQLEWGCETKSTLTGGMTSTTKLVELTSPQGKKYKAVLKTQNSNDNPNGLEFLENEREIVAYLQDEQRYQYMPRYFLELRVEPKYSKYKKLLTLSRKNACDQSQGWTGDCEINPAWAECNKAKGTGNLDTKKLLTAKERMHGKALDCPDTQLLAIEFLDGYMDLPHLQGRLQQEDAFVREVRAAALFVAYDQLRTLKVSHCDFNSGNAMFNVNDPADAKLIDFGLSVRFETPVGRCNGKLADLGPISGGPAPGHLWFALYRGATNEEDYQNFFKPGPLSLSTQKSFNNPVTHESMLPFARMDNGQWAMAPANHWPQIVKYANELLALYRGYKGSAAEKQPGKLANDNVHQNAVQRVQALQPKIQPNNDAWRVNQEPAPWVDGNQKRQLNIEPVDPWKAKEQQAKKQVVQEVHDLKQRFGGKSGVPACKSVTFDVAKGMFVPCKLTLRDANKCSINLECNGRRGKTSMSKEISVQDAFMGRIEIENCENCKRV